MGKTLSIEERIQLHSLWLDGAPDGVRFTEHGDSLMGEDLHGVNLSSADLTGANLTGADLRGAKLRRARLDGAHLDGADCREVDLFRARLDGAHLDGARLSGAHLHLARLDGVDLHGVDLHGADCRGANIDYSSWPLWCGTKGVIVDKRIARQLIDHVITLECDSEEIRKVQEWLLANAGRSHHAEELGLIDGEDE